MKRIAAIAMTAILLGLPAQADEVEESIDAALEAYRAGDIKNAREELEFASQLLSQMKAAGLRAFLPEPLPGWEREDGDGDSSGLAAFGGGQAASATYRTGDDTVEIQIVADNQMVGGLAGLLSGAAMMGGGGEVRRIAGQRVTVDSDGDLQLMIDKRIMIQISGSADEAMKAEYFSKLDIDGLKDF